jgi:predicted ATP-dependent endonuclease of OLD family
MYQSIVEIVDAENSRIQAIICTHSPRLIDRAPAQSIRLLQWQEGRSDVSQLETNNDPEVERFLSEIARDLGLTNTLMFYEQCFVLIEGATEENALPLFYRKIHQHSLLEDGIRLVNVESNGAFREFLKLLSQNRQEMTLILADLDTEDSGVERRLRQDMLRYSNFGTEFIGITHPLHPQYTDSGAGSRVRSSIFR